MPFYFPPSPSWQSPLQQCISNKPRSITPIHSNPLLLIVESLHFISSSTFPCIFCVPAGHFSASNIHIESSISLRLLCDYKEIKQVFFCAVQIPDKWKPLLRWPSFSMLVFSLRYMFRHKHLSVCSVPGAEVFHPHKCCV